MDLACFVEMLALMDHKDPRHLQENGNLALSHHFMWPVIVTVSQKSMSVMLFKYMSPVALASTLPEKSCTG